MKRPRTAFFDFACCEGCQLQVANLGEDLLDLLDLLDVVEFREVMSEKWEGALDIAVVEGSITDYHAEERVKAVRKRSKTLIAYGSCATIGGVNGMKNSFDLAVLGDLVYGDGSRFFPTGPTQAVHQVVPVEYAVNGCPVYIPEFLSVLTAALRGIPYAVPDYAVCIECKMNENECFYDRGIACLGPVTRAGCNSWCVNNGNICYGCRGMVTNPHEKGMKQVLEKHRVPVQFAANKMDMYNRCRELDRNGS